VSVVVKETQSGIYYTVIITELIFLVGGHRVSRDAAICPPANPTRTKVVYVSLVETGR
jgi:hypothetical protein